MAKGLAKNKHPADLGGCVAPTALGTSLLDFPALPGWAKLFRAPGA